MSKGNIRHMFPGGNTSLGFFSYYDYILGQEEAKRIIVIKGGPGVGKSSFMKKIGEEMVELGYDVEYMHCSSDNNSLDGLVIPAAKVALMDGTAPHVVDPKNPGAVDEIIHLGDFWNEEGIVKHKEKVIKDNREIGRTFARAYRYIKAAASIYEDSEEIYDRAMDPAKLNKVCKEIEDKLFGGKAIAEEEGKQRHLFASAMTPEGLKNHLVSILTTGKVYKIKGAPGTGTEKFLERIRQCAAERGYDVESYYCALKPKKLEHLIIPGLDVAFTTSNKYHDAEVSTYTQIELDQYLDGDILEEYSGTLEYNQQKFEELIDRAVLTISKAKALHDRLESYYIPNMDFEAVQRCLESTMARILDYAKNE